MDWVRNFYSKTGQWWGPAEAKATERDRSRAETIARLHPSSKTVLELGSGYGNTAAAIAQTGRAVVGVEISGRADFSTRLKSESDSHVILRIIKDDFYAVQLDRRFDVVCYWNGFGVGSDGDQRTLLRRIASEWLVPDGKVLIDIANPFVWAKWAGDHEIREARPSDGYAFSLEEETKFDPVNNRAIDTWWERGKPTEAITQTLRCYSPADLILLLEGTGLTLHALEIRDEAVDFAAADLRAAQELLGDTHEYLAILVASGGWRP